MGKKFWRAIRAAFEALKEALNGPKAQEAQEAQEAQQAQEAQEAREARPALQALQAQQAQQAQDAVEFQLHKYQRDREHELELNKFTHALEVERLKILQLLNGGAFTIFLGFSNLLLYNGGQPRQAGIAAALLWLLGLGAAAWATQVQLDTQAAFSKAYRLRRTAVEWRELDLDDEARNRALGPLKHVKGRPVFAYSDSEFEDEATNARAEGSDQAAQVTRLARASLVLFAVGAILMTIAFANARPPPPQPEQPSQPSRAP